MATHRELHEYIGLNDTVNLRRLIAGNRNLLEHGLIRYNTTPLILAVSSGNLPIIKILVEEGACVDYGTGEYSHPVLVAAATHKYDALQYLLDLGANANIACGYDMTTALIIAANSGASDIVQLLLDYGADINAQNSEGQTALLSAVLRDYSTTVKILVDRGADITIRDCRGRMAIDYAKSKGNKKIISCLSYLGHGR